MASESIIEKLSNYRHWDLFVFTLITSLSIYYGQNTIFYVIYFFWWNELINIIVDRLFGNRHFFKGSLFMMMIYGVFIVVFFGIIANWDNQNLVIVNLQVLLFKNWFFNFNIAFVFTKRLYLHWTTGAASTSSGGFTGNMIILHISIIIGGLLMFFVVKKYPQTFNPENLWGSILIISPFLLLKMGVQFWASSAINTTDKTNH